MMLFCRKDIVWLRGVLTITGSSLWWENVACWLQGAASCMLLDVNGVFGLLASLSYVRAVKAKNLEQVFSKRKQEDFTFCWGCCFNKPPCVHWNQLCVHLHFLHIVIHQCCENHAGWLLDVWMSLQNLACWPSAPQCVYIQSPSETGLENSSHKMSAKW